MTRAAVNAALVIPKRFGKQGIACSLLLQQSRNGVCSPVLYWKGYGKGPCTLNFKLQGKQVEGGNESGTADSHLMIPMASAVSAV